MVNVAVRTAGNGFASTVYGIDASPCPFGVAIDTQFAVEPTDQLQSRVADIVSVPCPPAAGKTAGVAAALTWHFWADGATTAVEVSVDVQAADPAAMASKNAGNEHGTGRCRVSTRRHVHSLRQLQPCSGPRCRRYSGVGEWRMRAQLTFILLLGLSGVAGAQHQHPSAPLAGTVPDLPPIGLPLPSIGLPHPPTGLPPLAASTRPNDVRQLRRPALSRHGSRRLASAVYIVPAIVGAVSPVAPDVSAATDPAAFGGQLRVEVPPGVIGQVYLDGYYVGTTEDLSRAMDVTSGRHSIEIRADGYQPAQDDIAVAAGRSVTYRGLLTHAPSPPAAVGAPPSVESAPPKTFYVIPGCYVGDVLPEESTVPGCDPHRVIAVRH